MTRQPGERSSSPSRPPRPLTTDPPAPARTIGRCYLRELERRESLRNRKGGWMAVGSAIAAVAFMAAWLGIIG